jgi:hypothetical protein
MAEGYEDILVDLLVKNAEPESFLLKNVWYVLKLNYNLLSVPQLLSQGITTVFIAEGRALLKKYKIIAFIDIRDRKFWLRTTNIVFTAHQKSLAVSNLVIALTTQSKKLSVKTWYKRLAHLSLDNLRKLKSCATGILFNDIFEGCRDCIVKGLGSCRNCL